MAGVHHYLYLIFYNLFSFLAIIICVECTFSQSSAQKENFATAFSVALHHYKAGGLLDTVKDATSAMLESQLDKLKEQEIVTLFEEMIMKHLLCMLFSSS
jgi:hypothetical protein